MPNFLALDWDEFQCRYALASVIRKSVLVHKIGVFDWAAPQTVNAEAASGNNADTDDDDEATANKTGETAADDSTFLRTLCSKIKELKLESCRSLLSLGRGKTEILYQKLPPCKESEVPVLLKNQVLRELPNCSDFDPLDYLPLNGGNSTAASWNVLALTIPLSYRQLLTRSFRGVHFPPQQIGFRAAAAASLFLQYRNNLQTENTDKPVLLVCNTGLDTDLILTDGRQIASIRSFRLPPEITAAESAKRIADEINRTVLAGLDNETAVQKIVIFGSEEEHNELHKCLSLSELETEFINLLEIPWVDFNAEQTDLTSSSKFVPLIGLLSEQITGKKEQFKCSSVDFLHPKEAPKPVNLIRTLLLGTVALIIITVVLYFWNRDVIRKMEQELAKLQEEYKQTAEQYKQIQPVFNVLRQTQYWDSQNIAWLDELYALSAALPKEQDLVISQMTFTAGNSNPKIAGTIQLNGIVRDPSMLWTFQKGLNSGGYYQMRNPQISKNPAGGGYPYMFQTVIIKLKR